ncbi:MAG: CpaF family protein [Candidatus Margulisiibacteriota bacterium]|nr:MAG: type II secretion system protein E [Candidatus Margulisbacteria bacterium GWD2_39_127]OGI01236.1 MAG: type II secretion system protein E [Candidatus Margulisbacteria bacterium GWF2_38_17]OGI09855.1 MAG: type II secretion system protein E [Candidatus Margulisbacteria bacterium GWE2_39_32]PZM78443.1 MAG: CpaF family protein [Candidatus Margulisiibacteriota bacterium]HAR62388.1 type II secretion system protein E [Candidatus Margulisiibacteriota bacterium]
MSANSEDEKRKTKLDMRQRYAFLDRVIEIHKKLIKEGELSITEEQLTSKDPAEREQIKKDVEKEVMKILEKEEQNTYMSRTEKLDLTRAVIDETIGLGPLEKIIQDEGISEIMVNGPHQTYVEYKGKLTLSDVVFKDNEHVKRIIDRIVGQVGRRIDEGMPMVDARLLDGSRVNAIIPPLALKGPTITIRKFSSKPLQVSDLVKYGSMTESMGKFLKACVEGHLNIIVSGGTGSGKTTLLNVLSSFIPEEDRIITVEDSAELQLQQDHVVTLETRPPNMEGKGEVSIRDLIKNCLRMRPERIVVGEVRGGEALDMLQAMNTGHDGSLTTGHANKPRDMIARLETMVMMSGMDMPVKAIRQQIASAFHLIVQQSRLQDGTRKVIEITEVTGMEGDIVTMQPIFRFVQTGIEPQTRKVIGRFEATGVVPTFYEKFEAKGLDIDRAIFDPYAH